jgi:hypothetical protein
LLGGPLCGRMGRDAEVQNAPPIVGEHKEYVQDLEAEYKRRSQNRPVNAA